MRLAPTEIAAIKTATQAAFGDTAIVRLFGSRVHDHLRGGDIDLHFEIDAGANSDRAIDLFEDRLFRAIDEQRIDKVFAIRGAPRGPMQQIGYRDGVIL
jgi:uncharacterized protein